MSFPQGIQKFNTQNSLRKFDIVKLFLKLSSVFLIHETFIQFLSYYNIFETTMITLSLKQRIHSDIFIIVGSSDLRSFSTPTRSPNKGTVAIIDKKL